MVYPSATQEVWTCRLYPCPSSAVWRYMQGVSSDVWTACSMGVHGVSLSTPNSLYVQGVSLSSACNLDMHGVCIPLHRHAALYLCKVYSHPRCFKCRNYRLDCPTSNQSGIGTRGPMQSGTRMSRYRTETPSSGIPMPVVSTSKPMLSYAQS